jgi:hypothetical protein
MRVIAQSAAGGVGVSPVDTGPRGIDSRPASARSSRYRAGCLRVLARSWLTDLTDPPERVITHNALKALYIWGDPADAYRPFTPVFLYMLLGEKT